MTLLSDFDIIIYGIPRKAGKKMQVCFIGHRSIEKTEELIRSLEETVVALIDNGVKTFLFGSMSEFNSLSWQVVSALKEKYPFIKRVYVRSNYPSIDKAYEEYLLRFYEETYFPEKLKEAGKCAYVERNYKMIDDSNYCVFYYNENYIPPLKRKKRKICCCNQGARVELRLLMNMQ